MTCRTLSIALLGIAALWLTPRACGQARAVWDSYTCEMGTVYRFTELSHTFVVHNSGDSALHIKRVRTSCGCTSVEYSRQPIAPGKSGYVRLSYRSDRTGPFRQSATVSTNAADNPSRMLYLIGEVKD